MLWFSELFRVGVDTNLGDERVELHSLGASPWQLCSGETGSCHESWHPLKVICKAKLHELSVVGTCREDARASGEN